MKNLKMAKIVLTGGNGFLGKYVFSELVKQGAKKGNIFCPKSSELDLRKVSDAQKAVFKRDIVIHLAANVGGIGYNRDHAGELFYDNVSMGMNLIEESRKAKVKKFVQVGTVCSYPKVPPHIPFVETDLWKGYPEETNAPYGLAKLFMLEMIQAYKKQYGFNGIYLLPANLYGPGDNFEEHSSHVIPALIKKFSEAVRNNKDIVSVWGSGRASREFLYVEDAARAIVLAVKQYEKPLPINIGTSKEIQIKDLVSMIAKLCGYQGRIVWDGTKPDGQPRRKLSTRLAKKEFGFTSEVSLQQGLAKTILWYKSK